MDLYIATINDFSDLSGYYLLPPSRQKKVDRYHFHDDKIRSLLCGLLLRYALKEEAFDVVEDSKGKLFLPNSNVHFNLSHSGDYVCLLIDDKPVGVDIEKVKSNNIRIMNMVFQEEEIEYVNKSNDTLEAFFTLWTLKESVMKYFGLGFSMPPKSFSVLPIDQSCHLIKESKIYLNSLSFDNHVISICASHKEKVEPIILSKSDLLID